MLGSVRVVSKRKGGVSPAPEEVVVDVDRANPILGNPYVLKNHNDAQERDRVIRAYEKDFRRDMEQKGPMFKACQALAARMLAGDALALACWCAPRKCHAEIIREQIYQLAGVAVPADKPPSQGALF